MCIIFLSVYAPMSLYVYVFVCVMIQHTHPTSTIAHIGKLDILSDGLHRFTVSPVLSEYWSKRFYFSSHNILCYINVHPSVCDCACRMCVLYHYTHKHTYIWKHRRTYTQKDNTHTYTFIQPDIFLDRYLVLHSYDICSSCSLPSFPIHNYLFNPHISF